MLANVVWHKKLRILIDLTREDLDHPELPGLWETVYKTDRFYGRLGVPVGERDLQCGGVCRDMGVEAPMHLRMRGGRREAVHERREDEERHTAPMSDEHKAYQERILRAAQDGGFDGDSEVRTRPRGAVHDARGLRNPADDGTQRCDLRWSAAWSGFNGGVVGVA